MKKLTHGMRAYIKAKEAEENRTKFSQSGRNIQVFGLPVDIKEEDVKKFFERYGEIESISYAKRDNVTESIFHYNILFTAVESA